MKGPSSARTQLAPIGIRAVPHDVADPAEAREMQDLPVATPAAEEPQAASVTPQQEADNDEAIAEISAAIAEVVAADTTLPILDPPEDVVRQPGFDEWKSNYQPDASNVWKWRSEPLLETPLFRFVQCIDIHDMRFQSNDVQS